MRSPYAEEVIARVPDGSAEDANRAVAAAGAAFPGWAALPTTARADLVRALADAIELRANDLAVLVNVML
ncbi:MAG TPA: aldehyde dehydrogenase family protein [Pseudonocardia sp.]|nr:aldehyde dehydrogenase family protein [Pseudonocardia sp.]